MTNADILNINHHSVNLIQHFCRRPAIFSIQAVYRYILIGVTLKGFACRHSAEQSMLRHKQCRQIIALLQQLCATAKLAVHTGLISKQSQPFPCKQLLSKRLINAFNT